MVKPLWKANEILAFPNALATLYNLERDYTNELTTELKQRIRKFIAVVGLKKARSSILKAEPLVMVYDQFLEIVDNESLQVPVIEMLNSKSKWV